MVAGTLFLAGCYWLLLIAEPLNGRGARSPRVVTSTTMGMFVVAREVGATECVKSLSFSTQEQKRHLSGV